MLKLMGDFIIYASIETRYVTELKRAIQTEKIITTVKIVAPIIMYFNTTHSFEFIAEFITFRDQFPFILSIYRIIIFDEIPRKSPNSQFPCVFDVVPN